MNRYYVFFQDENDAKVKSNLKKWEEKFSLNSKYSGFITDDIFSSDSIVDNIIENIINKLGSFENISELIFLPIISKPENIETKVETLKKIEISLLEKVTSDRLDGVYFFPLIKIGQAESNFLNKKTKFLFSLDENSKNSNKTTSRFMSPFLFFSERVSLVKYSTEDWLKDIECFISFIPFIEKEIQIFDLFPHVLKNEIASFTTKNFYSEKYKEIKGYIRASLLTWIEDQITANTGCKNVLIDFKDNIGNIKKIGSDVSEEEFSIENQIINKFKFFTNLKFSVIKNHVKEFLTIDLSERLSNEALENSDEIMRVSFLEYFKRVKELKIKLLQDDESIMKTSNKKLINGETTLNCLLLESEKNIHTNIEVNDILKKNFAQIVKSKSDEYGVNHLFNKILKNIEVFMKGFSLGRVLMIFLSIFSLFSLSQYLFINISEINIDLLWIFSISFILSVFVTFILKNFWKRRLRKKIELLIAELKKTIRSIVQTSSHECIRNKVHMYFNRFILRRSISLKSDFKKLNLFLKSIQEYFVNFKNSYSDISVSNPPSEIKKEIGNLDFNKIFSDISNWDNDTVTNYFNDMIEYYSKEIYKELKLDEKIEIEANVKSTLLKNLTFSVDENETKIRILYPENADDSSLSTLNENNVYKIKNLYEAKVILFSKRKLNR